MAGVAGLEPTVHWTKTSCLTNLAIPLQSRTGFCRKTSWMSRTFLKIFLGAVSIGFQHKFLANNNV